MENQKALNVAIVGGGPGCKAVMDMMFTERLSQLRMNLVGVACTNSKAEGYRYAQQIGIYTTTDYRDLYDLENLGMIIELTGRNEVASEIARTKPAHVRFIDHVAAHLFWDIFQIEEERLEERQRAQEALKSAEQEKEMILDTLMEHVIHQDTEMRMMYANRAAYESVGLTRDELIGRHCYEIWGKRDTPCPDCPVLKAMKAGEPQEVEKATPDGKTWFIRGYPVRDTDGRIVGGVEITLETTERKRAEEALRESERRYRNLVDNSLVGVYQSNLQGDILYVNDALAKMFEFESPEEMMSENVLARYKDVADRQVLIELLKRSGKVDGFEFDQISKTGKVKHVLLSAVLQGDTLSGMIMDITDRKRAEEALRESEAKYSSLVENSLTGIYIDQEGKIVFANKTFAEIYRYSLDELLGMESWRLVHPDDRALTDERRTRRLRGEEVPSEYEARGMTKDGKVIWIKRRNTMIEYAGKPAVLGNITDITESKRLEAQFLQAQKMEAVGTLAGGIAHDFNNLLMGIQGRTSLMLMDTDSDHPHLAHLSGIEDMVRKGADLSRRLLGFARGGKYEVRPTDLSSLVEKSSEMFGRTKKEIRIHRKYQKDSWPVDIDQGQIEQVLLNLYVNAWQAMPEGGDLYLETKNVTLDRNYAEPFHVAPGKYVKISVTDTGMGMDEATRQRVFEPFFTTRELGGGTGLGLASAYGIIQNHGGAITVYSEPGHGTTFDIYLPFSDKEVTEGRKPSLGLLEGTETVLLVDDEEMILNVGKEMLTALGYKVMRAKGGEQAIGLYEELHDQIDVVILDMIMPDVHGGEVYDRLKEINQKVKVLLSSGYSIEGQAREILERGCDGFIQKPFNAQQLSLKLREMLDGQ